MPFTETVTISRDAVGAADHTSNNPPLAVIDPQGDFVQLTWGDTLATILQNFRQTLQTGYKVSGFKGILLFVPEDVLGASAAQLHLSMQVWSDASDREIILTINNGGAGANLVADVLLGRLYFLQPLDNRKIIYTFS